MYQLIRNQAGMTLIELLMAMVIGMIVAAGAYSVFFSTTKTARKQEQVSEMQQNLRIAMERITQDIRQAGFGIPVDGTPVTFYNGVSFSSPITVTNSDSAPDEITLLGLGRKAGTIVSYNGATITVDHDLNGDDNISGYMELNVYDDDFSKFSKMYTLGTSGTADSRRANLSIGGIEFLKATDYTTGTKQVIITFGEDVQDFPQNLPVYIIQAVRYFVDDDCYDDDGIDYPCLRNQDYTELRGSGGQVYAEGIEDIQFAYGVDVSPRDGKIDYPSSGYNSAAFESDPADDSSIVAVRVSIVARSRTPEQGGGSTRPALEDRPAGTADRYSRRVLTKTIKLRNPRSGA